jgi:hypothetical protein
MHGVTGRMGMNQHLIRSIVAIRNQGGVTLSNGDKVMPDPILIGRNAEKIEALAKAHKIERWGTDLDKALPTRTTRSSSTPAPRRCAPPCWPRPPRRQARVLRKADRHHLARRWRSRAWPRSRA